MRTALLLISVLAVASCNGDITGLEPASNPATETFAASLNVDIAQMTKLPNGVYYKDLVTGNGGAVTDKADTVWVNYAGYLKGGKLFDSGLNSPLPMFRLVAGFRTGIIGMKEGGRRKLVIPSPLGYGGEIQRDPDGKTLIPRQSTLIFDVDLIKVHTPTPAP